MKLVIGRPAISIDFWTRPKAVRTQVERTVAAIPAKNPSTSAPRAALPDEDGEPQCSHSATSGPPNGAGPEGPLPGHRPASS